MVETYYSVLDVSRTASQEEIKNAYRQLIRQVHPDTLATASAYWKKQAEEKAKDVNEAYRVLSDPEKRKRYDQLIDTYQQSQTTATQPTSRPKAEPTRARTQTRSANPQAGRAKQNTNQGHTPRNTSNQQTQTRQTQPPPNASQAQSNTSYGQAQTQPSQPPPNPASPANPTQPTPPNAGAPLISATFNNVWAIYCLLLSCYWVGEFSSPEPRWGVVPSLLIAYLFIAWAAFMWRRTFNNCLSKIGVINVYKQAYTVYGTVALVLCAFLALGSVTDKTSAVPGRGQPSPVLRTSQSATLSRITPPAPGLADGAVSNNISASSSSGVVSTQDVSTAAILQPSDTAAVHGDGTFDGIHTVQVQRSSSASDFTLDLRAEEQSWVQVKTDGFIAWEGVLSTNSTRGFRASKEAILKLGNAPGVEISYNGKLLPRFTSDIKTKTLTFTPDGLSSR